VIPRTIPLAVLLVLAVCAGAGAHEVRPAYLQLEETAPDTYDMLWKVPARGEATLRLDPELPASCEVTPAGPALSLGGAAVERSTVLCRNGLVGEEIAIAGLGSTMTDVLVRIQALDGAAQTARLMPESPAMVVRAAPTRLEVAGTYLRLGIDHILAGFDHLLFVLALLLLVSGWRRLALTITAFTLAHSVTLAAATFELVRLPPTIVEALIALSIVLVAVEIVRCREGDGGLATRWPWLIAFVFGLLHGFGFAGALAEIGLPDNAIPEALLFFNVGVEAGQLMVVTLALTALRLARGLGIHLPAWSWRPATYVIGSLAAFWTIERLSVLA
jgi:hypothetical protein